MAAAVMVTALPAAADPAFVTGAVEYRLGESATIPLRVPAAVEESTRHELAVENESIIRILRQPEFLAGNDTGFARILTLAPGETVLKSGNSRLRVRVLDERPTALLGKSRPRFTTPPEGACLWGEVAVGVDIWVGAPGIDRDSPPDARLHLPDGGTLEPVESFPPLDGPFWRFMFALDTGKLPVGECELSVSCKPPLPGTNDQAKRLFSDPHRVTIVPPAAEGEIIASGECEDMLDTPRAERMGMEPPAVSLDPAASGHRAVALRRSRPAWVIQPEIEKTGHYQWMVRARGSLAGSAYPSLGVVVGEDASSAGMARLASATWHRVAVGRPFKLDAGRQWTGLTLANEFNYRNLILRGAEIDRFELRRIDMPSAGGGSMMMQGGMAMTGGPAESGDDKNKAPAARGLRCAFVTIVDGEPVNGRVKLDAMLHARGPRNDNDYRLIRSDLWINGERLASDYGRQPSFTVHPHDLKKGANRVEITSHSPCGAAAHSLPQTLHAIAASHPVKKPGIAYDSDRYDLRRGNWRGTKPVKPEAASPLAGEGAPPVFHDFAKAGSTVRFELSSQLTGKRRISLLAHAFPDAGPGVFSVKLHQPKARHKALREMEIASPRAAGHWEWQALAAVDLDEGPKHLTIELLDGRAALGGIGIDTAKFVDATAPEIEVLYPAPGARLSSRVDAVVLPVIDDLVLSHIEVQIDGRPAPLAFSAGQDTGPITLHLPGSLLRKGKAKLEVTAVDASGKRTAAAAIPVEVVEENGPLLSLPYPRAVRLADRLAFGPDLRTLARILTMGEEDWLRDECAARHDDPLIDALARVMFPDVSDYHIRGRVICELLATRKPVAARFSLFAQNHFSTWISKAGATAKWEEHRAFRELGIARFQDLLLTSATSPAMMISLDQHSSLDRQLNENYA
ncbi:MAG TPA: DUF1800 family protein, partial [Luteolibacter sp.]|nr:DUF1800 family protein [Luteolibacter sp.]